MKRLILSLLILTLFTFPATAQEEEEKVLTRIKRTGLLTVAVREDAPPFGYRDVGNRVTGVCLDFLEFLRNRIKKTLKQDIILIKLYRSTLSNRFDLVEDGVVSLECGPNTIRTDLDKKVTFSKPFFVTGTQLLVRLPEGKPLSSYDFLEKGRIGVIQKTTTYDAILKRYPQAEIQEFRGVTARTRGVQAVRQGTIDAFASDGILLLGEAVLQNLEGNFRIIPEIPIDCQYYGLVLPTDDPEWKNLVDATIQEVTDKSVLSEKWFSVVSPYMERLRKVCQSGEEL